MLNAKAREPAHLLDGAKERVDARKLLFKSQNQTQLQNLNQFQHLSQLIQLTQLVLSMNITTNLVLSDAWVILIAKEREHAIQLVGAKEEVIAMKRSHQSQ